MGQAGSEVLAADAIVWDWKREQRFCGFGGLEEAQPAALETIGRAGGQHHGEWLSGLRGLAVGCAVHLQRVHCGCWEAPMGCAVGQIAHWVDGPGRRMDG